MFLITEVTGILAACPQDIPLKRAPLQSGGTRPSSQPLNAAGLPSGQYPHPALGPLNAVAFREPPGGSDPLPQPPLPFSPFFNISRLTNDDIFTKWHDREKLVHSLWQLEHWSIQIKLSRGK